jgi:outer membrane protein assembly factor BamA
MMRLALLSVFILITLISSIYANAEDDKRKNYAFAPIIISNPNIGSGLGATGMYFFDVGERQEGQPRSSAQLIGAYTNTDSYFAGLLTSLYMRQDRIRGTAGVFHAKLNSDYRDPLGGEANFSTNVLAVYCQATYRLWGDWFLGGQALVSDVVYKPDTPQDGDYLERVGAKDTTAGGIGPVLTYDSRDNIHYPSPGTLVEVKGFLKPEAWGNTDDYAVGDAAVNHFIPLSEKHILALRGYGRTGTKTLLIRINPA